MNHPKQVPGTRPSPFCLVSTPPTLHSHHEGYRTKQKPRHVCTPPLSSLELLPSRAHISHRSGGGGWGEGRCLFGDDGLPDQRELRRLETNQGGGVASVSAEALGSSVDLIRVEMVHSPGQRTILAVTLMFGPVVVVAGGRAGGRAGQCRAGREGQGRAE